MSKTIIFLFIVTVIFLHQIAFHPNQVAYGGDIVSSFSPEKHFLSTTLHKTHTLPFWDPYSFGGIPFVAIGSPAVFYPINFIYLFLPINQTFGFIFMLDVFLLGVFTYLYGKKIGLTSYSSIIFSISFMFSGAIIPRYYAGHIFIADTLVWFPLLFYFYESYIQTKLSLFALLSALPIALMFLAGGSQFTFYILFTSIAYVFLRYLFEDKLKKNLKNMFFLISLSWGLGLAISAIQFLSSWELSKLSTRSNGISFAFASDSSLHPMQLLTFILPYFFGSTLNGTYWGKVYFHEGLGYIGVMPIVFFVISTFSKLRRKNKYLPVFFCIIFVTILYSFGKYFPLFYITHKYFPLFNTFRVSTRIFFVTSFFLAAASCFAIDYSLKKRLSKFFIGTGICGISIFISTLFILFSKKGFNFFNIYLLGYRFAIGQNHQLIFTQSMFDLLIMSGSISIFSLIYLYFKKNKISIYIHKITLLCLVLIGMWYFATPFIQTANHKNIYPIINTVNFLTQDKTNYRILDYGGLLIPHLRLREIEQITGIHSLQIRRYKDYLWMLGDHEENYNEGFFIFKNIKNLTILNLFNAKYILSTKPLYNKNLTLVFTAKEHIYNKNITYYTYKNLGVLPRAYIVPEALVASSDAEIKHILMNTSFNPKSTVILEEKPTNIPLKTDGIFQSAQYSRPNPDSIHITTNLTNPGYLVLSEIWYPGWSATDNGKPIKIYRANYTFRALTLNAGNHKIIFTYRSHFFTIGLMLSLIGISILVIGSIFLAKKRYNV